MPGVELKIDLGELERLGADLSGMRERCGDFSRPMKFAAVQLTRSIAENFQAGGRPEAWEPLAVGTLLAKAPKTKILIDSGALFDSIHGDSGSDWASAATDRIYGRIQQLGGALDQAVMVPAHERRITQAFGKEIEPRTVKVRAHVMQMNTVIPARPFMVVQDEDGEMIMRACAEHIMGR